MGRYRHFRAPRIALATAAAALSLSGGIALAAETAGIIHVTIQRGDSLSKLAGEHLGDPSQWPLIAHFNHVADPNRVEPGDRIAIPAFFAAATEAAVGVAFATPGAVRHTLATDASRVVASGDELPGRGIISVADGRAELTLPDSSRMSLEKGASIDLQHVRATPTGGGFVNIVSVLAGRLRTTVSKLLSDARVFEVRRGKLVAGVRGTEFAVDGDDAVARIAVYKGAIEAYAGSVSLPVSAGRGVLLDADGKLAAVTLPPVPRIRSPRGDSDPIVTVSVSKPDGVVANHVVISRDEAGRDVQFRGTLKQAEARLPGGPIPAGRYFVRAEAIDDLGFRSDRSAPVEFVVH